MQIAEDLTSFMTYIANFNNKWHPLFRRDDIYMSHCINGWGFIRCCCLLLQIYTYWCVYTILILIMRFICFVFWITIFEIELDQFESRYTYSVHIKCRLWPADNWWNIRKTIFRSKGFFWFFKQSIMIKLSLLLK